MINSKVIVCALARDCERNLIRNIPRIEKLRTLFVVCDVLVVENDSKDGTKNVLRDWAKKSNGVHLIINDFGTITIPQKTESEIDPRYSAHRISKMVRYRNMYLDWIKNQDTIYDYVIVIDIDAISFGYNNIDEIILRAPNDWGAICANGRIFTKWRWRYYDLYPFIETNIETLNPHNYYGENCANEGLRISQAINKNEYTPVFSAFAGLAIYKYDVIKHAEYQLLPYNGDKKVEVLCEHVSINLHINHKNFKVYISKNLDFVFGTFSIKYQVKLILFKIPFVKRVLLKYQLVKDIKAK